MRIQLRVWCVTVTPLHKSLDALVQATLDSREMPNFQSHEEAESWLLAQMMQRAGRETSEAAKRAKAVPAAAMSKPVRPRHPVDEMPNFQSHEEAEAYLRARAAAAGGGRRSRHPRSAAPRL